MELTDLQKITGLPFKKKGSRLIASCNIDGTPHHRHDKTVATIGKYGKIIISEQGGECMGLNQWIEAYGDGNTVKHQAIEMKQPDRIFVDDIHWESTIPKHYSGNLFTFLSTIFDAKTIERVFLRYKVGEDGLEKTIFWYSNELGRVCHDSIVIYNPDGKRRKVKGGYRLFGVDFGYTGMTLFGSHLIPEFKGDICVVESEKTALIMSIVDEKRLWLATGGSNKTSCIKENMLLFPDYDAAGSFWECIGCVYKNGCIIEKIDNKRSKKWGCHNRNINLIDWWTDLDVQDGNDVGDFIIKKYSKNERKK